MTGVRFFFFLFFVLFFKRRVFCKPTHLIFSFYNVLLGTGLAEAFLTLLFFFFSLKDEDYTHFRYRAHASLFLDALYSISLLLGDSQ